MALAPGKGAHLVLNEMYQEFLARALEDIGNAYSDQAHDTDPKAVITLLTETLEGDNRNFDWTLETDNFGIKAYASTPYKEGELRVTVVHTSRGELKLDIREWWNPNK